MVFDSLLAPIIVDVTLRDGGYLNRWEFTQQQISYALDMAQRCGVDLIEIGYVDDREGLPVAASWSPRELERFHISRESSKIAVMCRPSVSKPLHVLAQRKDFIDLVRIPVDVRNLEPANELAEICQSQDLPISFNLTSISSYSVSDLKQAVLRLSPYASCVYLADSRGALRPGEIPIIVRALQDTVNCKIGFHAHNNLGLALANTRSALESGCSMIDGSLCGIGLGGRNLDLTDAIELAKEYRPTISNVLSRSDIDEMSLGVSAPGEELEMYAMSGERNLKMEWVMMMIDQLGIDGTRSTIQTLPKRSWLDHRELENWIPTEVWRRLVW
jgi:4-hydroxy 2-oxovalerate aldolase